MLSFSASVPIFIGFKLSTSLKRELDAITGPDRKYVSYEDTTFLSICRVDAEHYVGKLVTEPLTTARVEDVKRNVLSIMRRLCPEERLPDQLEIIAAAAASVTVEAEDEAD